MDTKVSLARHIKAFFVNNITLVKGNSPRPFLAKHTHCCCFRTRAQKPKRVPILIKIYNSR